MSAIGRNDLDFGTRHDLDIWRHLRDRRSWTGWLGCLGGVGSIELLIQTQIML